MDLLFFQSGTLFSRPFQGWSFLLFTCYLNALNTEKFFWLSLNYFPQRRQWHPTPVLLPGKPHGWRSLVGCSPWGPEESDMTEWLHFHALEKEMATHSSVLAWRIPGTGEPGRLPSMGSHRVGHYWSNLAAAAANYFPRWLSGKESTCQCRGPRRWSFSPWVGKIPWRKKLQLTLVFLSGKSHGQRSLACYNPWGGKMSQTRLSEHAHARAHTHTHTHTHNLSRLLLSDLLF